MRKIFRNASINRYAFDVELLTIAAILHLKVQDMPIVMKIDGKEDCEYVSGCSKDFI
jgi:hypothetical protein